MEPQITQIHTDSDFGLGWPVENLSKKVKALKFPELS
jgi:hypothetical protein